MCRNGIFCYLSFLLSAPCFCFSGSNPDFMAANDLVWEKEIGRDFYNGAFIGDGIQGAMILQDDQNPNGLRMLMGHYKAITHNTISKFEYCQSRVFAGEIILHPKEKPVSQTMRLNLWDGQVNGTMTTAKGTIEWQAFADRKHGVFAVAMKAQDGQADALLAVREEWGITPRIYLEKKDPNEFASELPPRPIHGKHNGADIIINKMKHRGAHVVASQSLTLPDQTKVLYVAIAADDSANPDEAAKKAASDAAARVQAAVKEGFDSISRRHQAWWHAYMQSSSLEIPEDPYWQKFWWIQLYKFASASSETSDLVIDTQGPWIWDSAWAAVWWNLNVQLSYYPMYSANKLDAGRSLISGVDRIYKSGAFRKNAGSDPGIMVGRSSTYEGLSSWGDEYGNMPWLLHCYWKYWRYSGDDAIGKALFPMLKDSTAFLIAKLDKDENGILHMKPSRSPEYSETLERDTNYALMSLRWSLETLLAMNTELGFNDPQQAQWKEVLDHMAAFPTDEHGLRVDAKQGFDKGHRHYSHLLAVYPYHILNPDQGPQARDLITRSIDRWQGIREGHAGYTYTGGCAMYATLGDGNKALETLDHLKRFIEFNTMYREGGGAVVETPLSAVESINYMLLQSWGGVIRIFPAVADRWKNVRFNNFRTEGAFLVSAERTDGKISKIEITSEKGKTCTVLNPWKDKKLDIRDAEGQTVKTTQNGQTYTFATKPGGRYVLSCSETTAENNLSRIRFNKQDLFLNGVNLAWGEYPDGGPSFADDIGPTKETPNLPYFQDVFEQLEKNGANCMRLWLHTNGKYTPEWDGSMVISPGQDTVADLKTILDMAWEHNISLMLCLWSFDMMHEQNHEIFNQVKDLLTTPECRQSYIDHSLIPMVNELKGHPAIIAWEIFNEPEGMSEELGWKKIKRVPIKDLQAFVNVCAGAIHRTDPQALVTNGSWAFVASSDVDGCKNYYTDEQLVAAGGDPDGTLDFYCVHYYDWAGRSRSPFYQPASYWKLDKPIVIAEFFVNCKNCTESPYETLLQNGYAGALTWSWVDSSRPLMLQQIASVAKTHEKEVRIVKKESSAR